MGVPNTTATCSCGESKTYYPGEAQRAGFTSDYTAAAAWAKTHETAPASSPARDAQDAGGR